MSAKHDDCVGKTQEAAAVTEQIPEEGEFEDVDLGDDVRDDNEEVMSKGGPNKAARAAAAATRNNLLLGLGLLLVLLAFMGAGIGLGVGLNQEASSASSHLDLEMNDGDPCEVKIDLVVDESRGKVKKIMKESSTHRLRGDDDESSKLARKRLVPELSSRAKKSEVKVVVGGIHHPLAKAGKSKKMEVMEKTGVRVHQFVYCLAL